MGKSKGTQVRVTLPPGTVVKYSLMELQAPQGTTLIIKVPFLAKAGKNFIDAVLQAGGSVEYI